MMFLVKRGFAEHDERNKFLVKRSNNFQLTKPDKIVNETFTA